MGLPHLMNATTFKSRVDQADPWLRNDSIRPPARVAYSRGNRNQSAFLQVPMLSLSECICSLPC
jgi:hypothetical protein